MILIELMEGEIGPEITRLLEKLNKVYILLMPRFSDSWVLPNHAQKEEQRVVATVAKVAMDDDVEAKKEMVDIFVSANDLRRKVIRRIVEATPNDHRLAALFLESLCEIFAGFKDQLLFYHTYISNLVVDNFMNKIIIYVFDEESR